MKKTILVMTMLFAAITVFAQESGTLDETVKNATVYLEKRLPAGSAIAVLNFNSPTGELSEYVIEELTSSIVNSKTFTAVERRYLETLKEELYLQHSGDVSDETASAMGKKVGAQIVVFGSLNSVGNKYRMRVRAVSVETAAVLGQYDATVQMDAALAALLKIRYDPSGFSTGRKIGAGFGNLALGLGSFTMGDWAGGAIVAGGYAAAAGLILWDIFGLKYEDGAAGVPGGIGIGVAAATAVFGFIRPFFFHRSNRSAAASASPFEGFDIVLIPSAAGIQAAKLSYIWRF